MNFEKINANLWKKENKYYRLFAKGTTPNQCWLFGAEMREILDIDASSGKDIMADDSPITIADGTVTKDQNFKTA